MDEIKEETIKNEFEEYKDAESDVWKPENKEDVIEGILVNKIDKTGDISARYYIDDSKNVMMVWGTAVLDQRMSLVSVGDKVRITYKGKEETTKGRRVHIFKVEVAKRIE